MAANNAYAVLALYNHFTDTAKTNGIDLDVKPVVHTSGRAPSTVHRWQSRRVRAQPGERIKPRHREAYDLWHKEKLSLDQIRKKMSSSRAGGPLAASTVM